MLKKKIISTLGCALGCLFSVGASEPVQRYEMEYIYMSPAHVDKTHKSRVIYKVRTNTGTINGWAAYCYLYNDNYSAGTNFAKFWCRNDEGTSDTFFTTYTFIKGKENRLKIFFNDKDGTRTNIWFNTIFHDEYPQLSIQNLPSGVYEVNNVIGYEKGVSNIRTTNKYVFRNWYAENHIDVYNKIDFGMFSFEEYMGPIKVAIQYYLFQLAIPAEYGLFDDATDDEKYLNRIVFDFDLVNDGTNHYTLQIKDKIYVNPYTYQMSRHAKSGFVETKYLYLPKTGFTDLNKLDFKIAGENLGTMRLNFNYQFSVQANKSRIGDCVSSQYCIKSGDANYSEIGKEIVHD